MADEKATTTSASAQASTAEASTSSNPFQNIADRQAAANLTMGNAYDHVMVDESVVHSAGTTGANRRLNLNQMIDGVDRLGSVTDDIADQVYALNIARSFTTPGQSMMIIGIRPDPVKSETIFTIAFCWLAEVVRSR